MGATVLKLRHVCYDDSILERIGRTWGLGLRTSDL